MRLLLDQMFDFSVANSLRSIGHDVLRVSEVGMAVANDSEILEQAIKEERILVTLDEHFGDWAVLPLEAHPGVIRLRVHPATTANVLGLLLPFIAQNSGRDFNNHLVIVGRLKVRWIRTCHS